MGYDILTITLKNTFELVTCDTTLRKSDKTECITLNIPFQLNTLIYQQPLYNNPKKTFIVSFST